MNLLSAKKETPRRRKPSRRWMLYRHRAGDSGASLHQIGATLQASYLNMPLSLPSRDTKNRAPLRRLPESTERFPVLPNRANVTNRGLRRPPTPRAVAGMRAEPP